MSLPNDEFRDIYSNRNKLPEYTSEGITSEDIRVKVNFADRSIKDDIEDYVFLKPTKKRKKKRKSNSPKTNKMKPFKKVLLITLTVILSLILAFVGTVAFLINKGSNESSEWQGKEYIKNAFLYGENANGDCKRNRNFSGSGFKAWKKRNWIYQRR